MGQDEAIDYEAFPERRCRSFGERQGAGVKRMHVLSYLISCGFQRGVPRIIGRAIRGTLSNGAKIIDVFRAKLELDMKITHAVHTQILCCFQSHISQSVNRRVGKSNRDVPRKLASSIRGTHAESEVHSLGIARTCDTFVIVVVVAVVEFENRTATFSVQWRQNSRGVSPAAGTWRDDNTCFAYSDLMRLPMACSPNNRTIDSGNSHA